MTKNGKQKFRYISKRYIADNKIVFADNSICNQKYSWFTLFFWVLLQQFKFFFNTYFFVISVTQCFEKFRISSPVSSLGPWICVLIACLFKEAYDDYRRYLRDCATNMQLYIKYTPEGFKYVPSSDICVGDIILLDKNDRVPADMVLLRTADASGQLFIRTDQLDGETDWKLRSAVPGTQAAKFEKLQNLGVLAEFPQKDIYSFKGRLTIGEFENAEINEFDIEKPDHSKKWYVKLFERLTSREQKNNSQPNVEVAPEMVEWVYSTVQKPKKSLKNVEITEGEASLENSVAQTDGESIITSDVEHDLSTDVFSVQPLSLENMIWMNTVLASSAALGFVVYTGKDTRVILNTSKPRDKDGMIDIELNRFSKMLGFLAFSVAVIFSLCQNFRRFNLSTFVKFIVLFSYVIPISLKVTIEMARYVYAYYITIDKNIPGTIVRNSNIPEELGRISYFLTDKTGTLTKNEMEMKKIHLGTICYTQDLNDEISRNMVRFLTKSEDQKQVFTRGKKDLNTKVYELVQALCVCHNVTPVDSDGNLVYQASSPDEVAIVSWTEQVGMKLIRRERDKIVILDNINEEQVYEIVYVFPFTSESKRMGIILRHQGEILFFMKGADVVMTKIIKSNDWVEEETENMARDGLRTLVIAKKVLLVEEFKKFEELYTQAKLSLDNRNENIAAAIGYIEKDLTVLGLTGVEDKLQDNVKVTLENLRNGGMKVWMLTGDKIETAISIATSSRIFNKTSQYIILSNIISLEILDMKLREIEASDYDSLIVDGNTLKLVQDNCFERFIDIIAKLDAVVGCRFSPTQKALVARVLKERTKKVICCIGDGGNDVSMITEANVGIGIVGKEGNQASLAADYSINKFCYVSDLFFWHGRNSYMNSVKISHLIVHRGTILSVIQGLFCSLINFIPFTIYNGVILIAFITCYTFFPIFSLVSTSDVSRNVCNKFPELYKDLITKSQLSLREFAMWNFVSFYEGVVIMLMFFFFKQELFSISSLTFSSLIINEVLMVLMTANRVNKMVIFSCCGSLIIYLLSFSIFKNQLYVDTNVFLFVLKVLSVNCLAFIIPTIQIMYRHFVSPPTYSKLESGI